MYMVDGHASRDGIEAVMPAQYRTVGEIEPHNGGGGDGTDDRLRLPGKEHTVSRREAIVIPHTRTYAQLAFKHEDYVIGVVLHPGQYLALS